VIARVAADLPFYRNSGGGMTVSGGEPFAQPEFLAALLAGARARGIHTAVETCGQAATADLLAVAPLVDLFLYDLKLVDAERHRAVTGVGSEQILANLRRLVERAPGRVIVRLPLVPGLTDGAADLEAAAARLRELGLDRVHLQPYHPLGNDKYGDLGRAAPFTSNERPDVERAAAILARCGLVGTPP
jgi:pyruvate formate lyase activating enzyme